MGLKKTLSILIACLAACQLYAQQNVSIQHCMNSADNMPCAKNSPDSLLVITGRFITPVIFDVNKYNIKPTAQLEETVKSIQKQKDNIAYIYIEGSASPEGSLTWNKKLGQYRAAALTNYLSTHTGLGSDMFRTHNAEEDWDALIQILAEDESFPNRDRILEILSEEHDSYIRKREIRAIDGGKTWRLLINEIFPPLRNARLSIISAYPKLKPIPVAMVPFLGPAKASLIQRKPEYIQQRNWKIAVKTNLLFDAALVANLGIEISPWKHWSLDIPVCYSPYSITQTRKIRLLSVQPEIRWWFKEAMSGHFIGLHTHVAGFNIALNDYARYQDPNKALWGMGLSYGYAISLDKKHHWGMEFTIGAGFAKYQYDAYHNWDNGQKFTSGSDCYWGITRAGVTLSYKWDISHTNRKR